MNIPKISVLVPVYKVEPYLQRCIDSVLNQDFTDWELILVDDGSPDRCPEICDRNAAEHPDKIKVVHKENGGLITARKAGVQVARGEYYAFVDSDDTLRPGSLRTLYSHIIKGYDMVRGGAVRKHSDGKEFPLETYAFEEGEIRGSGAFTLALYTGKVAPYLWGALYKASLFSEDVYDESIKQGINVGEDSITNLIIAPNIKSAFYIKNVVYVYYENRESYMSTYVLSNEYLERTDGVLRKHGVFNTPTLLRLANAARYIGVLNSFFVPELHFTREQYLSIKKIMENPDIRKLILERVPKKRLLFFNCYYLFFLYTIAYRLFFKYIKLHGRTRKVLR